MGSVLNDTPTSVGVGASSVGISFVNSEGREFDSIDELIEDSLADNIDMDEEVPNFSHWVKDGNEFFPAVNTQSVDKLPPGVYKIVETRDDYKVIENKIDTDELYEFPDDFTSKILAEAKSFWASKKAYQEHNLTHKRGILLCGSPGSGKTSVLNLLIKQIISNDGIVFMVSCACDFKVLSYVLKPIIRKIEPDRPIITIIEDIDQIIDEMGGRDSMVLDFMDGKSTINNHFVILTSNDTTDLSEALLRPSRIDTVYEILNPIEKIRKEYFIKKGISKELASKFAKMTDGFSFAQLKEVFIGTEVQKRKIEDVISQLKDPFKYRDYLNKSKSVKGF